MVLVLSEVCILWTKMLKPSSDKNRLTALHGLASICATFVNSIQGRNQGGRKWRCLCGNNLAPLRFSTDLVIKTALQHKKSFRGLDLHVKIIVLLGKRC